MSGADGARSRDLGLSFMAATAARRSRVPDRIAGKAKEIKGAIRENVGALVGSEKTEPEGAAERAAGKVQTKVGVAKDKVRETTGE